MTREQYAHQLEDLRGSVVAMASMVEKAIDKAVTALAQRNVPLAQQVVAEDRSINEERWRIEEQALLLIATQAPMAKD
jgi:phosphate transport system protein